MQLRSHYMVLHNVTICILYILIEGIDNILTIHIIPYDLHTLFIHRPGTQGTISFCIKGGACEMTYTYT